MVEVKYEQVHEEGDTVCITEISKTHIQRKLVVEEIVAPDTPREIREDTVVQKASLQEVAPSANNDETSLRPKTWSKNKLRMNMKAILNPGF